MANGLQGVTVENGRGDAFDALPGQGIQEKLQSALANKVVVFGRSTCPFCIEVTRTLVELSVTFVYYRLDQLASGSQVHDELKKLTGQKTVPYVFIGGKLVGGCDATKALIAEGRLDALLGAAGAEVSVSMAQEEGVHLLRQAAVDSDAPRVIGALLEFPNTVDGRIIRLVATQVFFVSLFIAIFSHQERRPWKWVSVGLLADFCIRFYGGAGISPLGAVAQLLAALWDLVGPRLFGLKTGPVWGAGPPKQFAVGVGILFSAIIVVMQFTSQWQATTAFAACLTFFAALEAFVNFCAGCWVFGHAIKFGVVPDSIYTVHINTLPEIKYAWEEWTKRVHPPKPERVVQHFAPWLRPGSKPTKVDLNYKIKKTDDWEREDFDLVRHAKIGFFSSVIGVVAIPALFRFMSLSPRFSMVGNLPWQILSLLSLVYTSIFLFPYLLKMVLYPHKVWKEWMHPVMNNAFTVPSMTLVVYAFLADGYSNTLAKVLFWAGASTAMLLSVIVVGEWLSRLRAEGHVNGSFQMAPVGLFIVAVVGPILDRGYTPVSYLWFGFALLMWITLFVFTFQRQVLGHNSDPRGRMFSAIWIAAPAVASIAWAVLNAPAPGMYLMSSTSQALFYMAVCMGLVILWGAWRRFYWADKFFMQMWAFGFPTAALAWAAVLYDATVQTALTKVLAVSLSALACLVATVLALRTLAGICRLKVFIPEHRWGPMSHLPLAQEALRHMLQALNDTSAALADSPNNARLAARLGDLWYAFKTVNGFYSLLKASICFPQIGTFFPGHEREAMAQNKSLVEMTESVDARVAALLAAGSGPKKGPAAALGPGHADTSADVAKLDGSSLAEQVAAAINSSQVVVVGRSTCPFCIEITRTLAGMGLSFPYFLTDKMAKGAAVHEELKKLTGQKTVPYVFISGKLVGGCDATKALIAEGRLDALLGAAAASHVPGVDSEAGPAVSAAAVHTAITGLASYACTVYDYVEDHIRPVTRRYIPLPIQRKITNDCWDDAPIEGWFQTIPLVVRYLPMLDQRATYVRAFLWAMPERAQQMGVMLALGLGPVDWYRLKRLVPDIVPRGEAGWKHY